MVCKRSLCCRSRPLTFLIFLFGIAAIWIMTNVTQIEFKGHSSGSDDAYHARHNIIEGWRKAMQIPAVAHIQPMSCKGEKCEKYLGLLGLADKEVPRAKLSQHCKQPQFLTANDTIGHTFSNPKPLNCPLIEADVSYKEGLLTMKKGVRCIREEITKGDSDNDIAFVRPSVVIDGMPLDGQEDFFRVRCVKWIDVNAVLNRDQLRTQIDMDEARSEYFLTRVKEFPDGEQEACSMQRCLPYNVLILGVGSLSRVSFERFLPKTYSYFIGHLKSINLAGYNVVGYGSAGAFLPLLTGLHEDQQPEARKNKENSHFVDKLDLVWKSFDRAGYQTLYAEDNPTTSTFNDKFHGFEIKPTSHYMRPFWLAVEQSSLRNRSQPFCLGGKPKHQYLLEYLLQFHASYKRTKRFAVAMLKELTEADVSNAAMLDSDLQEFFKKMESYLQDTIVFFMSDHGISPTQAMTSWQAKIEARMPLMSIYLPTGFLTTYANLAQQMITNEDRLTTAYDVHATLKDIIDVPRLTQKDPRDEGRFGISLFKTIPVERTCSDAGVDTHWCACMIHYNISRDSEEIWNMAKVILSRINDMTAPHRAKCLEFPKVVVMNAARVVSNEEKQKYEEANNTPFQADTVLGDNFYHLVIQPVLPEAVASITNPLLYEVTIKKTVGGLLTAFSVNYELSSSIIPLQKMNQKCLGGTDVVNFCVCKK